MASTHEGNIWRAGDDLDIETYSDDKFRKVHAGVIRSRGWKTPADAVLWMGTDSEVVYESPDGPIVKSKDGPKEICDNYLDDDDDGRPDCLDSDCREAKNCQVRQCPEGKDLVPEIEKALSIVASPATPVIPRAISAVKPNYELLFDHKAFVKVYDCRCQGISLKKCLAPKCPDCKVEKPKDEKKIEVSQDRYVRYVYRHYVGLKVAPVPEICGDGVDNDLDGSMDCRDSDCASEPRCRPKNECGDGRVAGSEQCDDGNLVNGDGCNSRCRIERKKKKSRKSKPRVRKKPTPAWPMRIDVGLEFSGQTATYRGLTEAYKVEDIGGMGFRLQAAYGLLTVGLTNVSQGYSITNPLSDETEDFEAAELNLTSGLSYLKRFGSFDIEMRALLAYIVRELDVAGVDNKASGEGVGVIFGGVGRYRITERFGVYGALELSMDSVKTEADINGNSVETSEAAPIRGGFGVSAFWN